MIYLRVLLFLAFINVFVLAETTIEMPQSVNQSASPNAKRIAELAAKIANSGLDDTSNASLEITAFGKEAVPALLKLFASGDFYVTGKARRALDQIFQNPLNQTDEFRDALIILVNVNNPFTAGHAMDMLERWKDQKVDEELRNVAKTHPIEDVRKQAIDSMSARKLTAEIFPLGFLQGSSPNAKRINALAVEMADPRYVGTSNASYEISAFGKEAVPVLLRLLAYKHSTGQARTGLARIFMDPYNRTNEFRDVLIRLIKIDHYQIADNAMMTLEPWKDQKVGEALRNVARTHPVEAVRKAAISSLSAWKLADENIFLEFLDDPSIGVQCVAAAALGKRGNKAGFKHVIRALEKISPGRGRPIDGSDYQLMLNVLQALESIGDTRALPYLEKLRISGRKGAQGLPFKETFAIQYRNLTTEAERKAFLRKTLKLKNEAVVQWAIYELSEKFKENPDYADVLREVASDPKHQFSSWAEQKLKSK